MPINLSNQLQVEEIKKKLLNHDKNIELVFSYLNELLDKKGNLESRTSIGCIKD